MAHFFFKKYMQNPTHNDECDLFNHVDSET